ncbi:MAG: 5-(carboxyamino)imidazole ribonucleotide mutase [Clostridia bacterium]|jgi:5-(carboxyamino)imidazole ribonucleotide mutase|uniref:N5-carboxyaminoimidazole ribonucleotide mutase n=1 Tax=Thermacetogenium phaeum TaxID=85874 RepID=A0A101FGP1_9THEO|nr:MAG: N5-carboxyaminoimidazole ribonucleotide mutase [Thermacetogenium phaeum]MDK2880617.1 5-(carboxyamino)imidazole ribonucleotide mutase [Clostridia bacterium]MDN5366325.1 5-(carboxyamino)imidazole ribonucleotide mutase [Thermacetogenium sp.]
MEKPLVGIVLGSDSDLPVMEEAARILDDFGVPYEMTIASAHRSPELAAEYARTAEERGLKLLIAGAGMAAHLPGVLAAYTCLPVIGVPLRGGALNGLDALYSIVQMPPGVPVATVAIDGARNAALLAVQILGLGEPVLRERFRTYKEGLVESVVRKAEKLKERKQ